MQQNKAAPNKEITMSFNNFGTITLLVDNQPQTCYTELNIRQTNCDENPTYEIVWTTLIPAEGFGSPMENERKIEIIIGGLHWEGMGTIKLIKAQFDTHNPAEAIFQWKGKFYTQGRE